MTGNSKSSVFLDEVLRLLITDPVSVADHITWAAGRVLADDSIAIVWRSSLSPHTFGRRYVLDKMAPLFEGMSMLELAHVAAMDEITEPSGQGRPLDVAWADSLVDPGVRVRWIGE